MVHIEKSYSSITYRGDGDNIRRLEAILILLGIEHTLAHRESESFLSIDNSIAAFIDDCQSLTDSIASRLNKKNIQP